MISTEAYREIISELMDELPEAFYRDLTGGVILSEALAIPDYARMIFLDTIVANPDRHTANFGLLRDTKTGELLRHRFTGSLKTSPVCLNQCELRSLLRFGLCV